MKHFSKLSKAVNIQNPSAGFTLVELLLATSVAGLSIVTITTLNKRAEAKTERRIDLSRAFDFMSNEVRMVRKINRTATTVANGTTITLADVVTSSRLSLSALGSYGTIVLYLETPITTTPTTCPPGGPNAGLAPPAPADHDRVVYDIRSGTNGWLGPRVIGRYGRIPKSDGTIDPCSNPVASDTLVDSISDTPAPDKPTPTCTSPAILSGAVGFYACVNGGQVEFYLNSDLPGTEVHSLTSKAVSRLPTLISAPELSGTRTTGTDTMMMSWTWTGFGSVTFKLYRRIGGVGAEVYSGTALGTSSTLTEKAGDEHCYTVTATDGLNTSSESNAVCEPK